MTGDLRGTTRHTRIGTGPSGPGGWHPLVRRPASTDDDGLPAGCRPLVTLVHVSDVHICDAESPARVEYLDRHADHGEPYADVFEEIGTYRPQEILTAQVAAALVDSVNRLDTGPLGGAPLDAVLVTGDVIDNAQANELETYLSVLGGGRVLPASGHPETSSWVGAATAGFWSDRYWHPDGDIGWGEDRLIGKFGYPRVPGLAEAARRAFDSPGFRLPWLTVHGNHDALLQGTVAPSELTRAFAVGDRRVIDLAPGQTAYAALEATAAVGPVQYVHTPDSPTVEIPADSRRTLLGPGDLAAAHLALPGDHGFGSATGAYWTRDVGSVRLVALDTVNPYGGWEGSLDDEQFQWLRGVLAESDRPVVISSHHPSWTLRNGWAPTGATRRVLADEVIALLLERPDVVLWLAGHVHANVVRQHASPHGGLLEIATSSLIDWPQQARVVEVLTDPEGGLVVAATMVDHGGWWPADETDLTGRLDDPIHLAGLSRELAINDYRARNHPVGLAGLAGPEQARNAVWRVPRDRAANNGA